MQVESQPGQVEANLSHATRFVEQAARDGAAVVVLPELFATGYIPNPTVWDVAEPRGGTTTKWIASTAKRLSIYLGAGTVETDGSDFFNVFVLAGPDGRIAGRAYKTNAEAYVFKRDRLHAGWVDRPGRGGPKGPGEWGTLGVQSSRRDMTWQFNRDRPVWCARCRERQNRPSDHE